MSINLKKINGSVAYLCGADHASKDPIKISKSSRWYSAFTNGTFNTCGSYLPKKETTPYMIYSIIGGLANFNGKIQKCKPLKKLLNKKASQNLPSIIKSSKKGYDLFYLVNKYTPSI